MKKYLLAGLLVCLPLFATLAVFRFLIEMLDKSIALLPHAYRPEVLLGFYLPGVGVLLSLLILLFTGFVATNFLGRRLVAWWEWLIERIPVARSVYTASKQVLETLFSSSGNAFRHVLLVEYPRRDMWSLAFQTAEMQSTGPFPEGKIMIFIPTTPNPTSGFLMLVDKSEVQYLDMSVDDAFKLIISLGVVMPGQVAQQIEALDA